MASQVDVVNLALAKLATDRGIAAMSDASKEARTASRLWDTVRDEVLEARNWPFALTSQALALEPEPPHPGWRFRYARPNDCLTLKAVTDESGLRMARGGLSCFCDGNWLQAMRNCGAYDYEQVYGGQGTGIQTDIDQAYGVYIARVEDTGRYSSHFVNALATRLAAEMAPAIIGERGISVQQAMMDPRGGAYMVALSFAGEHAFNQSLQRTEAMTPALAARG